MEVCLKAEQKDREHRYHLHPGWSNSLDLNFEDVDSRSTKILNSLQMYLVNQNGNIVYHLLGFKLDPDNKNIVKEKF